MRVRSKPCSMPIFSASAASVQTGCSWKKLMIVACIGVTAMKRKRLSDMTMIDGNATCQRMHAPIFHFDVKRDRAQTRNPLQLSRVPLLRKHLAVLAVSLGTSQIALTHKHQASTAA